MNAVVVQHPSSHAVAHSASQLDLIRRTVAKDCNAPEFDLFIAAAQRARLDPLRKQIGALVFNKNDEKKRRMAIVTHIDGLRAIADRSGQYSPDEEEPRYEYDPELKGPTNPLGLVKAVVRLTKNGRAVIGVAYWDEFVPLKDEWGEDETGKRGPTGKKYLEKDSNWQRMGRLMLAKVAEAQALRKGWPEDTSGLYEHAEMDQAQIVEVTASEIVEQHHERARLGKVGAGGILFQLFPNAPLENIPLGQVFDRVDETIKAHTLYQQILWFESANRQPMNEYWARQKGDALELKKRIEARKEQLKAEAEKEQGEDETGV